MRSAYSEDMKGLERRLSRLEKRSRWVSATVSGEWPVDPTYNVPVHPGNDQSALVSLTLTPGRWHLYGSMLSRSGAISSTVVAALHVTDFPEWQVAGYTVASDVDIRVSTAFPQAGGDHFNTCHLQATMVLDRVMYAQMGLGRIFGAAVVTVEYARLFAVPG